MILTTTLRKEKILLPNKQNNFDWEYMENMIKKKWEEIATSFKKELGKTYQEWVNDPNEQRDIKGKY